MLLDKSKEVKILQLGILLVTFEQVFDCVIVELSNVNIFSNSRVPVKIILFS